MVGHWSLWGEELWQDLWASGQTKTVTIYHVMGHLPSASPGNDEADTLAQVPWLEGKPASDVAHTSALHVGYKTMLGVACWWDFEEVSRP